MKRRAIISPPDDEQDMGVKVPIMWNVSGDLEDAVKRGALKLREESEHRPPSRERIIFRASELGNALAVRDAKGEPSGCAIKPWFRFHADRFAARKLDAEAVLNFAKGSYEEGKLEAYLQAAGILVETQVMLGAWAECRDPKTCARTKKTPKAEPTCGVPPYVHGDPRYPDRSRGNARGKCDFIIDASAWVKGAKRVPLEWKSTSSYQYPSLSRDGPKVENALQGGFYGHEMRAKWHAIGYTDKESGGIRILVCRTLTDKWWDTAFERLEWLRALIVRGEMPPRPFGVHPPEENPKRTMRDGWNTYRIPEPYYDKVWPCYVYGTKKKRVTACEYFEHCHGVPLPKKPEHAPELVPRKKKTDKTAKAKKPRKVGAKGGFTVVRD